MTIHVFHSLNQSHLYLPVLLYPGLISSVFATFGTPCVVKSDNGPPFNGEEFAKFASALCFTGTEGLPHCGQGPMEKLNGLWKLWRNASKLQKQKERTGEMSYKHYYVITAPLPWQLLTLPQRHYYWNVLYAQTCTQSLFKCFFGMREDWGLG